MDLGSKYDKEEWIEPPAEDEPAADESPLLAAPGSREDLEHMAEKGRRAKGKIHVKVDRSDRRKDSGPRRQSYIAKGVPGKKMLDTLARGIYEQDKQGSSTVSDTSYIKEEKKIFSLGVEVEKLIYELDNRKPKNETKT